MYTTIQSVFRCQQVLRGSHTPTHTPTPPPPTHTHFTHNVQIPTHYSTRLHVHCTSLHTPSQPCFGEKTWFFKLNHLTKIYLFGFIVEKSSIKVCIIQYVNFMNPSLYRFKHGMQRSISRKRRLLQEHFGHLHKLFVYDPNPWYRGRVEGPQVANKLSSVNTVPPPSTNHWSVYCTVQVRSNPWFSMAYFSTLTHFRLQPCRSVKPHFLKNLMH